MYESVKYVREQQFKYNIEFPTNEKAKLTIEGDRKFIHYFMEFQRQISSYAIDKLEENSPTSALNNNLMEKEHFEAIRRAAYKAYIYAKFHKKSLQKAAKYFAEKYELSEYAVYPLARDLLDNYLNRTQIGREKAVYKDFMRGKKKKELCDKYKISNYLLNKIITSKGNLQIQKSQDGKAFTKTYALVPEIAKIRF